jgi:hypothetical protein
MLKTERAISHPETMFADPVEVLHSEFAEGVKRRILESWEYSLIQRQDATDENMPPKNGDENNFADRRRKVRNALVSQLHLNC